MQKKRNLSGLAWAGVSVIVVLLELINVSLNLLSKVVNYDRQI